VYTLHRAGTLLVTSALLFLLTPALALADDTPAPPPVAGGAAKAPPTGGTGSCPPWICKDRKPADKGAASGSTAPAQPAPPRPPQPATSQPAASQPTTTPPAPTKPAAAPAPAAKPAAPAKPVAEPASTTARAPAGKSVPKQRKDREQRRFIEGELANVGATGLVPWQNRFGIVLGPQRLGPIYYGVIRPEINYTRELGGRELSLSFALPIRLEILDTRPDKRFANAGSIRKEDWDEVSDFARVISYINYGGKEEHVYLDINQFKASSIGHGTVLKRYNPNLNLNSRRVGFQFDAFGDYGGFETYLNDITGPNVMGALAFLKPLSLINRNNYFLRSFSIGVSVAADIDAPMRNRLDTEDADDDGKRDNELSVDQKTYQPNYISTEVVSYGSSVEAKLVDTDAVDWKTYVDLSFLETGVPTDDPLNPRWTNVPTRAVRSSGLSWGHLLRLNLDRSGPNGDPFHALRIRLELRQFDPNYLPSYFDTLYEIQRVQYVAGKGVGSSRDLANQTKQQSVLGRDPNGEKVRGFYVEASWKVGDWFAFAAALEANDRTPDNNFFAHFEVPNIGGIQFLITYHRRTARSLKELFSGGFGNNDVLIAKGRYRFSDALAFNAEALTPFGIGPDSLFRNTLEFNINAEIGFSYGKRSK
jgi:hypothetical protein